MTLFLLAYLGGVLTIVSPCILPVLPFVFARTGQPFARSGLPMLAGMALTFAIIASLAAVTGGWAVEANRYGRAVAMTLLALFGIALLFPELSDRLTRPLVALGARLSRSAEQTAEAGRSTFLTSLLLGIATGLLWAPCAGPVLGLILTGAALQGASIKTSLLLLAYAAGAATSLSLALLVGGRLFAVMKQSLGVGEWVRRALGVAVLAAVAAIAFGLDTDYLTRVSLASTVSIEQSLLDRFRGSPEIQSPPQSPVVARAGAMTGDPLVTKGSSSAQIEELPIEGALPSLSGASLWLNSSPLTSDELKGKVVLVDFWTYSCINCLRALPYVRAWAEKYKNEGLVVIGVHAPEFAFEKDIGNVRRAVSDLKIDYPVAIDNDYAIWRAFSNQYWPAHYFIDAKGHIRHHHFGEGDYEGSEQVIRSLLAEAGKPLKADRTSVNATGIEAAPDLSDVRSPETYIGYDRAENFASPGGVVPDAPYVYARAVPQLNGWGLSGDWTVGGEHAVLNGKSGSIFYKFHARDLHLVLGPAPDGRAVRFRVTIDGAAPGASHGIDVDAEGHGVVTNQRLYQLVRQSGAITDHLFEIQFLDPDVQAYAFTFG